ncbi:MAG: class I SAM-dependent methyltransferase [Planctomycetota bacterium]|nr:class I SAM-dependent methyltransferase [Planctomycetota bacterium]
MNRFPLYSSRAHLYDLIYQDRDYEKDAARLHEILSSLRVPDGSAILEAACGTGRYLKHLRDVYHVSGFDKSPEMLAIAREKVAGVPLFEADMGCFEIDDEVSAVLCLFSSIGYLIGEQEIAKAFQCFNKALKADGVVVIDPWVSPSQFRGGTVNMQTYSSPELKICRQHYSRREGRLSLNDFHWMIGRQGMGIETFQETHELWLCEPERMVALLNDNGFQGSILTDGLRPGRPLIIGRKVP